MSVFRVPGFILMALLCGCVLMHNANKCPSSWEQTMEVAAAKAKAEDYDFIMDHLLAPELVESAVKKYGADKWRAEYPRKQLRYLAYYFGWLKKREVRIEGDKVFLKGEAECYATFIKVDGRFYILDFGQRIISM